MYGISERLDKKIEALYASYLDLLQEASVRATADDKIKFFMTLIDWEFYWAALSLYELGILPKSRTLEQRYQKLRAALQGVPGKPVNDIKTFALTYSAEAVKQIGIRTQSRVSVRDKSKPTTILLVIDSLGPGGAERQYVNMLNFLSADAEEINVKGLILNSAKKTNGDFHSKFIDVDARRNLIFGEDLNTPNLSINVFPRKTRNFSLEKIITVLRNDKVDICVAFLEETAMLCGVAAVITGVPVLTRFGSMPNFVDRNRTDKQLIALGTRFAVFRALPNDRIIWGANSRTCLLSYLKHITPKNFKHKVINNIVIKANVGPFLDTPVYGSFDSKKQIILSVMRLSEEKRPDLLVKLSQKFLFYPKVLFVLVGDGPLSSEVERFISQFKPKNFCWIKSSDNVGNYYENCYLYLMTSRVEGSPNAVLEAALHKKPVIVANVGGVSDILEHEKNALFVSNPNSIDDYFEAILRLLKDRSLANKLASQGYTSASKLFSGLKTKIALLTALELI